MTLLIAKTNSNNNVLNTASSIPIAAVISRSLLFLLLSVDVRIYIFVVNETKFSFEQT